MIISVPGPKSGSTPPAALVSTTIDAPRALNSSTGCDDQPRVVALVQVEPTLQHHRPARLRASRGATARRARGPSPPATPAGPRTGSRPDRPGRPQVRRAQTPGRCRPEASVSSAPVPPPRGPRCAPAALTGGSAALGRSSGAASATRTPTTPGPSERAGGRRLRKACGLGYASRGDGPRPAGFCGRREYRAPGCRSRPAGRLAAARAVAGNEAPEATGERAVVDVISAASARRP